jgi:replicative DNA helicase
MEDGRVSKAEDINDLAQQGKLPSDPKVHAQPANANAQEKVADDARLLTVKQLLTTSMAGALKKKDTKNLLTTGHWEIDRDTDGFRNECVWVFGAKSSWGKSSYLIMIADENIKKRKRVLIVSAEDSPGIYGDRLMIRRSRVDRYRFTLGCLSDDEKGRVRDVVLRGEDVPVYLDARGKGIEWTAKRVRQLVQSENIDLVAWDYLHAFEKDKRIDDPRLGFNYIARVMTDTTKTTGRAGIIFAQVTPDNKELVPDMYTIRDTKDVVNAAEVVGIGFEPRAKIERDQDGQKIIVAEAESKAIVLAKNKPGPGPKGRVYGMTSDKDHQCFDVTPNPSDRFHEFTSDAAFEEGFGY